MSRKITASTGLRFIFTLMVYVLPRASFRVSGAIIRAWFNRLPVGSSIWNAFAGTLMANTPPDQLQAILPSTFDTYNAWVLRHDEIPRVDVLAVDNSTRLLWLGPKKASKVVLFFHGGGYVMPLSDGHLEWTAYIRSEAAKVGIELSICLLEYDLIPENPYPRQMMQGISALKHLLASGYQPSQIVFGGDSAGGHLSLSLLSHLHHTRPSREDEDRIVLSSPVKGCFLVSPLASFDFSASSYRRWFSVDVLDRKVVNEWGAHLVRNSPWQKEINAGEGWGMALDVPETWWDGLNAVDNILVTGGYQEVFSDHVQQLGELLKRKSQGAVKVHMANEAHDGPLMDFAAGKPASETSKAVIEHIISCLKE